MDEILKKKSMYLIIIKIIKKIFKNNNQNNLF